jgi:hypothetical protein
MNTASIIASGIIVIFVATLRQTAAAAADDR